MRLLSFLLPLFLICIPSVTPSLFSRLHSAVHRFHSLQTTTNATSNDILAFQYALTLERLNYAFFNQFQQTLNESWPEEQDDVYQQLEVIKAHEETHISTIELALINLGTTPVPACNYNFSLINNTLDYITTAALLKNTGVYAYAGAINSISDPILQQLGVTITTVDARHASYLNYINEDSPFPFAFDLALRPQDAVASIISLGIIESCPFELPSIYPVPNPEGSALSLGTSNTTLPISTTYGPYTSSQANSDLITLQLLYQFSNLLMAYHGSANFTNSSEWASYRNNSEIYYTLLVNQNIEHSIALASVIIARNNGTLVEPCTYNFTNTNSSSLSSFLTTLDSLQTTILYAYDGIINHIYDLELQTLVTTIATVHSRHTGWIRELIDIDPFQQALDNATTPEEAISQVLETGYIVSCPQELVPPPPRGAAPTSPPTSEPTDEPTSEPTSEPTDVPTGEPTSEPTDGPTSEPTDEPTDAPTDEPTDEPTIPPGPNPTNPPYPGPNGNDDTPTCPAINFTHAIVGGVVYFNTTTNKSISYVDVHITVANQFLNYRMNQVSSNGSNDTKVYTYQLPDFAYGAAQYWFTYVTPDAEGILRGCDSETYTIDIPIPPGHAGTNPPTPPPSDPCPAAEFEYYVNGTTIYFNVTSNTNLSFVDIHATHEGIQWNYRMIENDTIYSLTLPSHINFSISQNISFFFTYSTGTFQCDTGVFNDTVTLTPSTPTTSAPTTLTPTTSAPTTSAPTNGTTTTTAPTTDAPTTAPTTSAPTTGTGTTTAPTTDAPTTSTPTTSAPTSGNETTSTPTPTLDPALVDFVPPGE